jgi:integrase
MDVFYSYVKAAGLDHANFHTTRHTFATRAIEKGMDIVSLSHMLGHAQVSTTLNMYAHSFEEQKQREIAKLNEQPEAKSGVAVQRGGTHLKLVVG